MRDRLTFRNRVAAQLLDLAFLRRIVQALLRDLFHGKECEIGIYVVGADEMTRLNETFLRHGGVTDVITFNYAERLGAETLNGEILVCVDESRIQARRFRTSWQKELIRYIVHGLLHLQGYDDRRTTDRRKMKRRENQLLKRLANTFPLEELGELRRREKP